MHMKILLLVILILLLPVFELFLIMQSSAWFGVSETLLLIILSALLGVFMLRFQGVHNVKKMKLILARGGLPTGGLLESVFIILGGIALLLPGFITDITGFMLLIPLLRRYILFMLVKRLV